MIPPLFHWIWLGTDPMPKDHRRWIDAWLALHPSWGHRIWGDNDLPILRNRAAFERATTWAQRADIARYEILLEHGGVYLDTDMECVRPIDSLLEGVTAFVGEEWPGYLGNAVLGAIEGHPWMAAVVEQLPAAMERRFLVLDQTGPGFLTIVTRGYDDVMVFPREVFYPLASTDVAVEAPIGTRTHAVHHFRKSWAAQEADRICVAAINALDPLIPLGERVVVVSGGLSMELPHRVVSPFVERDGQDWGAPSDDAHALAELERQRSAGTHWFAFLPIAFWWLDHYPALAATLRSAGGEQREDDTIAVFYVP
jgi:inositol phosphorylceramide mannosyltransferase catalytic subunit